MSRPDHDLYSSDSPRDRPPIAGSGAPAADDDPRRPRRFRWPIPVGALHPVGAIDARWRYGSYFPLTDLVVTDMGHRGTGVPSVAGIEWLDAAPPGDLSPLAEAPDPPAMPEQLGRPEGL